MGLRIAALADLGLSKKAYRVRNRTEPATAGNGADRSMRILMTGHLGYIGTAAVPMFQARGHEVVGLDTDLYRDCTFGPEAGRCLVLGGFGDFHDSSRVVVP